MLRSETDSPVMIRMLCSEANKRQFTLVEVMLREPGSSISFCCPSEPRDEHRLVDVMGGRPVDDAHSAWGKAIPIPGNRNTVKIETARKGDDWLVRINSPPGTDNLVVSAAWSHELVPGFVFVSVYNDTLPKWNHSAVVVGGTPSCGKLAASPLSRFLRYDMAFSGAGVVFGPLDVATLITFPENTVPLINMYVPTVPQVGREYRGLSGPKIVDNTSRRSVVCFEIFYSTTMLINGCYLRDPYYSPAAYVPLTFVGTTGTTQPIIVEDERDTAVFYLTQGGKRVFSIDANDRDLHREVFWLSLKKL